MMRPHPRSTRTHPLVPYTTLFRSLVDDARHHPRRDHAAPAGLLRIMGVGVERPVVAHAVREIADTILGRGLDILARPRSEEHTSELQSIMRISYAVFCLKKKKESEA